MVGSIVYHSCGRRLLKSVEWNGQSNVVTFEDYLSQQEALECPGCGEALLPNDMGITIFTPYEWQEELKRRKRNQMGNENHKRGRLAGKEMDECTKAFMEAYGIDDLNGPDGETYLGWLGIWVVAWKAARRQAMEDVCSTLCEHCKNDVPIKEAYGVPVHGSGVFNDPCDAWKVRVAMRKEGQGDDDGS